MPPLPVPPMMHPAEALRRAGSGPDRLGPMGLLGDLPDSSSKKKRVRGGLGRAGRRVQEKKQRALERDRLERRDSGGRSPPVKVTGANRAPLGNGVGAEAVAVAAAAAGTGRGARDASRSASPRRGGSGGAAGAGAGGGGGEYVMVDAPGSRSGGGAAERKGPEQKPASKTRLRSVVATPATAGAKEGRAEGEDREERAAKKSRVEPGSAAAAIAAATAAQRAGSGGISPGSGGGRRVLNAEERAEARRREKEGGKAAVEKAEPSAKGAAAAGGAAGTGASGKQKGGEGSGGKAAAEKEEKKGGREGKAAAAEGSKKRRSASPSPGGGGRGAEALPERLRGRISWPAEGSPRADRNGDAAAAAGDAGGTDRWAPGSDEGEHGGAAWVGGKGSRDAAAAPARNSPAAAAAGGAGRKPSAAAGAARGGGSGGGGGQASCLQEFSAEWYWRPAENLPERGPISIREMRELVQDLEGSDKEEMMWLRMYTKGETKYSKFLKHLLNMGDAGAPDRR